MDNTLPAAVNFIIASIHLGYVNNVITKRAERYDS
jgi:hypothetical protein